MTCCRYVTKLVNYHQHSRLIHLVQSFTLGRPPGFTLAHIDCKKPYNEDPNSEGTCTLNCLGSRDFV